MLIILSFKLLVSNGLLFNNYRKTLVFPTNKKSNNNKICRNNLLFGSSSVSDEDKENYFDISANNNVDIYGDSTETDENVLENMRIARQIENDRWQSCWFQKIHEGEWNGFFQLYQPFYAYGGYSIRSTSTGNVKTSISASIYSKAGVNITLTEDFEVINNDFSLINQKKWLKPMQEEPWAKLFLPTKSFIKSNEFRIFNGNQAVGNVYTLCSSTYGINDDFNYLAELAVRIGSTRTRVKFLYNKSKLDKFSFDLGSENSNELCIQTALNKEDESLYDLGLSGIMIIREKIQESTQNGIIEVPFKFDLNEDEIGDDIYDPQENGEPYLQLNLPGKLTLLFPRGLNDNQRFVITIQSDGDGIRYQLDRKFISLINGAIKTLELTEIKPEDTVLYPASSVAK
eukprot:gene4177-5944_t